MVGKEAEPKKKDVTPPLAEIPSGGGAHEVDLVAFRAFEKAARGGSLLLDGL